MDTPVHDTPRNMDTAAQNGFNHDTPRNTETSGNILSSSSIYTGNELVLSKTVNLLDWVGFFCFVFWVCSILYRNEINKNKF